MADEDFDNDELEDDDEALEPDLDADDFTEDAFVEEDLEGVEEEDDEEEEEDGEEPVASRRRAPEADDSDDEDEEDGEDVEASLDVILKERLVVEDIEIDDDDNEEGGDNEDRGDSTRKVTPRRPDEFVCQSCFLVKHPSQLADKANQFCRDCV